MDDLLFGAGGGGGGGPERFFRNLPPVTRIWLMSTLLVTALANFDFVKWTDLGCGGWHDVWGSGGRAEIWRYGVVDVLHICNWHNAPLHCYFV